MAKGSKPENTRARKPLTVERLRELVTYDPETGVFRWRQNRYAGTNHKSLIAKAGDVAGSKKSNIRNIYRTLTIDNVQHYAHRMAWLYVTGSLPPRRQCHLGSFDDPSAAHAAYVAKAKEAFGEFARAA